MAIRIRPYRLSDFDALYALWQAALGSSWSLSPDYLRRMISGYPCYDEGDNFAAELDGQIVGFAATQTDTAGKAGGIHLLMVSPERRHQGIGTRLCMAAVERLQGKGVERISLAHGGRDYLWPGVPLNSPGAVDFFKSCGWKFPNTSYDLTRDLSNYQTPPGVLERAADQHIDLRLSSPDEAAAVLEFERRVFPFWAEYYQMTTEAGRFTDILTVWDGSTVVGNLLLEKGDVTGLSASAVWHQILGDDMGIIAAVGVAEERRGQGIGLAMVARASEILQARGVRRCLIGWTDLLDFYGRLGYTVWRSYAMTED